ncbi:uncharacterized protein [Drosophila kikkawai]|uniref:Uncharacterized protein n=1 Tax=Drosophila kikkawai TaxID=30033 RepID=A0A6P4JGI6_DROKI|nr:uncharacterized protein LOC108082711 [Drosophila kikkawai]
MGSCLGSCATATAVASNSNSTTPSSSSASSSSTASSASCVTNICRWHRGRPGALARESVKADRHGQELISTASSQRCQNHGLFYRILRSRRRRHCPQFLDKYWEQQPSYAKLQSNSAMPDIQMQNLDACKLLNAQATTSRETEMGHGTYHRMSTSRASSSLDLEWEHEYSQLRQYQLQQKEPPPTSHNPRYVSLEQLATVATMASIHGRQVARHGRMGSQRHGGSFTRTSLCSSTQNSWSHISTPESLEWDVDEEREQQRQLRLEDDNLDDETLKLLYEIEQLKHHVLQETGEGLSMRAVAVEELTEGLQFRATHFGGDAEVEARLS